MRKLNEACLTVGIRDADRYRSEMRRLERRSAPGLFNFCDRHGHCLGVIALAIVATLLLLRRAGQGTTDLARPLNHDQLAHQAVVHYLTTITHRDTSVAQSVRTMVRQLLPTGTVTRELIAAELYMHPKALQRQLSHEGLTFGGLVDQLRRDAAAHYLRDTHITLSHLARELGYTEQSALTRSCRRWFGSTPAAYRKSVGSGGR